MTKLLRADFRRLFKSKLFWIASAFMLLLGLIPIDHWLSNREGIADGYTEVMWHLEDEFFSYVIALLFIITIMTALFVGAEYAGGALRSKLIVGHKRSHIYLSNLIVLAMAMVIWSAVYLAVAMAVGIPLLGMFHCGLSRAIAFILLSLALSVAVTAIMLMVAMLCPNRTHSAIISLMLVFVLLMTGIIINGILQEPEYYDGYTVLNTETGKLTQEERSPNPNYVSGTKRLILEEALDLLPGGQLIEVCGMSAAHPGKLALYDLLWFVLCTGVGLWFWRKKDLK